MTLLETIAKTLLDIGDETERQYDSRIVVLDEAACSRLAGRIAEAIEAAKRRTS